MVEAAVLEVRRYEEILGKALPDGDYPGKWSGYEVYCCISGMVLRLEVDNGIRGLMVPCVVRVRGDKISVGT